MITDILESLSREGIIQYETFFETLILANGNEIRTPKKRLMFVASRKDELKKVGI